MEMDITSPPDVLGSVEEDVLRKPWRTVPVRTYDGKTMRKNLDQNHLFLSGRSFRGRQGNSWARDNER